MLWPPIDGAAETDLKDWDAWYSGDPDILQERYYLRGTRGPQDRPSQYRNGVLGRFARWWWGQPTPFGEKRTKLHVPLAGDIARTSADLLFSEPPKLSVEKTANTKAQQRLEDLMNNGLQATLLEGGEVCAGLGGSYMRVVWDDKISNNCWIDIVHHDCAVPDFSYGHLTGVTFWRILSIDGATVVRHLERREPGFILHGVYVGSPSQLGKQKALTAYPETKNLQPVITLPPSVMTAEYVPNVRPARGWRHIPSMAYWGQSDFQGVTGLMDALDETYSSWMRDIRLGKGRVITPNSYLTSHGPGRGASWDEDREIYAGLDMLVRPTDSGSGLTINQFDIRVQEHSDTAKALVEQIVRQAGYSAATFGEAADGQAITATEIRSRERRSMVTRSRKALYWGSAIRNICEALLVVERFLYKTGIDPDLPDIQFQDSISEDPQTMATTANLLAMAEAASIETRVRLVNPDWDDDDVATEVLRIKDEKTVTLSDPTQIGNEGPMPMPPDPGGAPDPNAPPVPPTADAQDD
jgi:hypothetical protein